MMAMRRALTVLAAATLIAAGCSSDDEAVDCPGHRIIAFDDDYYVETTADGADVFGPGTLEEAQAYCATL